jgi:tetratricopeptide (TPR) repeat protein
MISYHKLYIYFMKYIFLIVILSVALPLYGQDTLRSTCNDKGPEDYRKTVAQYTKFLAKYPGNEDALYGLGMSYYKLREFNSAIATFDKLIALNPKHGAVYLDRGLCKYFGKDKDGACEDFKKCIAIDQDYDDIMNGKKLSEYVKENCR